jgi:hypothetical protein
MVMLLQFTTTGGDLWVFGVVFALSVLSILLSVSIAVLLVRGYRSGPGHEGMLLLAIGLILLTTVPEILRIGLPTFTPIDTVGRVIITSSLELGGLGAIIWAIYGGSSE